MNKGGLGRGLGSLISGVTSDFVANNIANEGEKINKIETYRIKVNPRQPREFFGHQDLEDLVESIKRYGILQPLIVTPDPSKEGDFILIAGERRLRASKILEFETVPCIIRTSTEQEQLELALIENIQRAELNPLEEAGAYQRLMDEFNLTQEEAAAKLGKKRTTIANALRLLDLPKEMKQAMADGKIGSAHGKILLSITDPVKQKQMFKKILSLGLTVRQAETERENIFGSKKNKPSADKPLLFQECEERLRGALNTKIKITGTPNAGSVIVDFYSADELKRLTDIIDHV